MFTSQNKCFWLSEFTHVNHSKFLSDFQWLTGVNGLSSTFHLLLRSSPKKAATFLASSQMIKLKSLVQRLFFFFWPFSYKPTCDKSWTHNLINIPFWSEAKIEYINALVSHCLDIRICATNLRNSQKRLALTIKNPQRIFLLVPTTTWNSFYFSS